MNLFTRITMKNNWYEMTKTVNGKRDIDYRLTGGVNDITEVRE